MSDAPSNSTLHRGGPLLTVVVHDAITGEIVHTHIVAAAADGGPPDREAACREALEVAALLAVPDIAGFRALAVGGEFDVRQKYEVDVATGSLRTPQGRPGEQASNARE